MSIKIERLEFEDVSMEYFRFGKGSVPLVILPGLSLQSVMGAANSVAEEYSVMSDDFTVYLFDRRENLPSSYNVHEMARDTAKAIKKLGLRDICLFGASQGGMIAMDIAAEDADLVRCLALSSTCAVVSDGLIPALSRWISMAEARDGVGLSLEFGRLVYPEEVFEKYKSYLIMAGNGITEREFDRFLTLARGTAGFDVTDKLHLIKCPVLISASTDDAVFGGDAAKDVASYFNGRDDVELHTYTGYGHALYDTAPDHRELLYKFFMKNIKLK